MDHRKWLPQIKLIDMSNSSTYVAKGYKRLKDAVVAEAKQIDPDTQDPILLLLAKYTTSGPALLAIVETAAALQDGPSAGEIETSLRRLAEAHGSRIEDEYRARADSQAARRVEHVERQARERAQELVERATKEAEKIIEDAAQRADKTLRGSKFDRCNTAAVGTIRADLESAESVIGNKGDVATLMRAADAIRYERNRLLKEKESPKKARKPNSIFYDC